MRSALPFPDDPYPDDLKVRGPWAGRAVLAAILLGLAGLIWWAAHQQSTTTRRAAEDSVLIPLVQPPPPPPPPPEVVKPPPPEEVPPPPSTQPTPQPEAPQPTPQAAASPSAGQAVSIDGPAQAGGDGFNIGAGSGGGMRGGGAVGSGLGGFNRAAYASYLEGELRRAMEGERSLRSASLKARARLWIDASGKITRVEVADSPRSDQDRAEAIRQALVGRSVRPPDASLAMPVALSLDIRRAG